MSLSAVRSISGLNNYRVSSVHGNPYSLNAVQKIGNKDSRRGKALVIEAQKPEEDLYVKDYGRLANTKSTATGDFAEMLSLQESRFSGKATDEKQKSEYSSYLNDTIGMMGFQNGLRDRLNGVGFTPFQ